MERAGAGRAERVRPISARSSGRRRPGRARAARPTRSGSLQPASHVSAHDEVAQRGLLATFWTRSLADGREGELHQVDDGQLLGDQLLELLVELGPGRRVGLRRRRRR